MKRTSIFSFFLLTLTCLTGCSEKDAYIEGDVISFATKAEEMVSRADLIDSSGDLNQFTVWGNYDGNEVFVGQSVERVEHLWSYTPLKQWVLSANQYDFSAFSPASAGTPNIVDNTLQSVDYDSNSCQEDLVMAYTTVAKSDIGKPVRLDFKHALAAVNFTFRLKEGFDYSNTYKVVSVKWGNIYSEGRFLLNSNNSITTQTMGNVGESYAITDFTGAYLTTTSTMVTDFQFFIPQALTNVSLIFNLEINGVRTEISRLVDIDWASEQRYTYTISIDPYEISVETTPWEIPDVDDIIIQ